MLVAFLALLAFLGGFGGKSAKNVECARGGYRKRINSQHCVYICHFSSNRSRLALIWQLQVDAGLKSPKHAYILKRISYFCKL